MATDELYETWVERRLHTLSSAPDLEPSMVIDLALDENMTDDDIDEVSDIFGRPQGSGWGFSDVFDELLSREPKKIPAPDLATTQENLIKMGYIDPDTPVDGVWSPTWSTALKRADRDAQDSQLAGNHMFAAPMIAGVRLLGNVLPSKVISGVVASAKGMVAQAPETAERVGLAGGAVAGGALGGATAVGAAAATGAAIGSAGAPLTLGASIAVGAAIGATVGFLADLLGKDEGEAGQTGGQMFLDALSPWEEYAGSQSGGEGAQKLFEDLGFVASAASIIAGAGAGVGAVRAGSSAIAGAGGLSQSLKASTTRAIATQAGGVEQGWLRSRILNSALGKKFNGPELLEKSSVGGLKAWRTFNPVLRTVEDTYTAAASSQLSTRYLGGLGSGEKTTAIEEEFELADKTIAKAPGMEALDWTVGNVIFPKKFFALGLSDAGKTIRSVFATGRIDPYVDLATKVVKDAEGNVIQGAPSHQKAIFKAKELLGEDPVEAAATDQMLKTNFGLYHEVGERVQAKADELGERFTKYDYEEEATRIGSELRAQINEERARGVTTTEARYAAIADENPDHFAAYLKGIEGFGSDFDRVKSFKEAQLRAERVMKDFVQDPEAFHIKGKGWKTFKDPKDGGALIPVRNFDATNNVGGYTSQQDYDDLTQRLLSQARKVRDSRAAVGKAQEAGTVDATFIESMQRTSGQQYDELRKLQDEFRVRDILDPKDLDRIMDPSERNVKQLAKRLNVLGKQAGREIEGLDPQTTQFFSERGYRLVATGEDMLFFGDIPKRLDEVGVWDAAMNPNKWESIKHGIRTLGMDPNIRTDRGLAKLRIAHEESELHQVLAELNIPLTGRQARRLISSWLHKWNNGDGVMNLGIREEGGMTLGPGRLVEKEGGGKGFRLYKFDPREMNPEHIVDALGLDSTFAHALGDADPYEVANKIFKAIRRGATFGGETDFRHPISAVRMMGKATKTNGLPGFSDFVRTLHYEDPRIFYGAAGAATGAVIGASDGEGFMGALEGGLIGGATGAGLGHVRGARAAGKLARAKGTQNVTTMSNLLRLKFPEGTYGYLPDKLHRLNMALRYSFSLAFDLGRRMEQNMIAYQQHQIPSMWNPGKHIIRRYGENSWNEAKQYYDNISGGEVMRQVDDIDRRATQVGMTGFSPKHHEAAQAWILKQRGKMSDDQIFEAVRGIGGYGMGRSAAEKSVNFVFFPFSFQKKLITTMGDWMIQSPPRAFMIHHGLKTFFGMTGEGNERTDDNIAGRFGDWVDKHLPILKQLQFINNLAYGFSPGRFFLEGIGDRKTDLGVAAEILGSTLAPGGVATPVAQAFGGVADAAVHAFIPVVVTEDTWDAEALDAINKYIPLARELTRLTDSAKDQWVAVREPQGGAPYSQLTSYLEEKSELEDRYEPMAQALGYASASSFLNSEAGAIYEQEFDAEVLALQEKYPTGFKMAQTFTNSTSINQNMLMRLAEKPDRTAAEDVVVRLAGIEAEAQNMAEVLGMEASQIELTIQQTLRQEALKHIDDDEFRSYWARFFANKWGPIERTAA